jgi:hypothetical protein
MTLLFAGNELSSFQRSGTNVVESTTSGTFDSSRVRCSLLLPNSGAWALSPNFTASTTVWIHAEVFADGGSQLNGWLFTLVNSSGVDVVRMGGTALSTNWHVEFFNGSAWVQIGNNYTIPFDHRTTLDIMIKSGVSGGVSVYLDGGPLVISGSGDLSAVSNFQQLRVSSQANFPMASSLTHVSQIIVADEPTIQWCSFSIHPTAAGTHTDWTGLYTDVNETVLDDTTFIYTTTASQLDTFPVNSITLPGGYIVKALVQSMRARISTAGPQNAQFVVRTASTDYASSNVTGIFYNYQPFQTIWTTNPNTSAAWTQSDVNAAEIGVKSIT